MHTLDGVDLALMLFAGWAVWLLWGAAREPKPRTPVSRMLAARDASIDDCTHRRVIRQGGRK